MFCMASSDKGVNPCCYPFLGMSEFLSATPLQTEGHDVAVQYTFASDCHYECCCINRVMVAHGWDIRVPLQRLCAYPSRVGRGHWMGEAVAWWGSYQSWRSEEHTSELQSRPHLVCRL